MSLTETPQEDYAMNTMRSLFLNPPSFEGFDGGAGSRYQTTREVRSFWYPTWLAQPAAMIPNSKLIDAPADDISLAEVVQRAKGFELCVIHTSTPSFESDVKVAQRLKETYPDMIIGLVGAHVAVLPQESLEAAPKLDFVAREEFDYAILEVSQGHPWEKITGISYRKNGQIFHNVDRALIANMDELPSVLDVYKRDLTIESYYNGYLKHPYLSLYTGRGCPARCTFCLWPQTVGGHVYRTKSVQNVIDEMIRAKKMFPQVKDFFFDDDTFTADLPRAAAIAKGLGKAGISWSSNARANIPYEYLKIFKDNGVRLFLVGYESGNQKILNNIKKGIRVDIAREFTKNCRKLGIVIHGTFILGLPGENKETIEESIKYAQELDVDTIQVSLAAPYPGTELYREAMAHQWYDEKALSRSDGTQACTLSYPHLSAQEIEEGVMRFYSKFYARPRPILRMLKNMLKDSEERKRRLREGREFFHYLRNRKKSLPATPVPDKEPVAA